MTSNPTCWKHAHQTRAKAEKHAAQMRRAGLARTGLRVYQCGCGAYHVGHVRQGADERRAHR